MQSAPGIIDMRDAFFSALFDLARRDTNVVFLTADMGAYSLGKFKAELPGQYINIGIAEQNMASVAAGLSLSGKKVFIYAIAPFVTQRCYEQIKVDISGMNLPVTVVGIGGGISYNSDGLSHHATQDIAVMRALPNFAIYSPSDAISAAASAVLSYHGNAPSYVRLDKGTYAPLYRSNERFSAGVTELKKGNDILIISTGPITHNAMKVSIALEKSGLRAGVADLYRIKPLNGTAILKIIKSYRRIATLEEHSSIGGIGSAISELLTDNAIAEAPLKRLALRDCTCDGYGDREWMLAQHGLDINSLANTVITFIKGAK